MTDRQRLRRLADLAAMLREADLARLSQADGRLRLAERQRDAIEAGMAAEARRVAEAADMTGLRQFDDHSLFVRQKLDRLGAQIATLERARMKQRDIAARSFGRASVLATIVRRS